MKITRVFKCDFILWLLLLNLPYCTSNNTRDNNKPVSGTSDSTRASYYLPVPAGWTKELISFPITFAPEISYKGIEDLRFAKGWGDIISDEHWCYAFTWWLDGNPAINEEALQKDLTAYYTGLVQQNINKKTITVNKIVPTIATIKTSTTLEGDIATFSGTIHMLNYLSETPIDLHCIIHLKQCNTRNHTALLFLLSPKPPDHRVWNQLNMLNTNFICGN